MQITINRNGQHFGPYTAEEAAAHVASGGLLPTDWAWAEGMGSDWKPLSELLMTPQSPPPVPQPPPAPQQPANPKPEDDPYATIVSPTKPPQQ